MALWSLTVQPHTHAYPHSPKSVQPHHLSLFVANDDWQTHVSTEKHCAAGPRVHLAVRFV